VIISASRRTDIPALYGEWFRHRLRAGYCLVPNPFNARQVTRVSLLPADVDAFVFWTRHGAPFLRGALDALDTLGHRYYFQYTVTGYGRELEPCVPSLTTAIEAFVALARRCRKGAVVWRYDPILLAAGQGVAVHLERFAHIATALRGVTERVVVSLLDIYRKTERRLRAVYGQASPSAAPRDDELELLCRGLVRIAADNGMLLSACAEPALRARYGIERAKCIDDELLRSLFGGAFAARKDPGQRPDCGCVVSRDIGVADTCTLGCVFCYATRSTEAARRRRREHDPQAPMLWS